MAERKTVELRIGKPQRRYFNPASRGLLMTIRSPCMQEDRKKRFKFPMEEKPVTIVLGSGLVQDVRVTGDECLPKPELAKYVRGKARVWEALKRALVHEMDQNALYGRKSIPAAVKRFCIAKEELTPSGLPVPKYAISFNNCNSTVSMASCLVVIRKHEKRASYELIRLTDVGEAREFHMGRERGLELGSTTIEGVPMIELAFEPYGLMPAYDGPGASFFDYVPHNRPFGGLSLWPQLVMS